MLATTPICVYLVVEDLLSESICRRMVSLVRPDLLVIACLGKTGIGAIKRDLRGYNRASRGIGHVVLVDQDRHECAPRLISDWFRDPAESGFLLRVATHEIESWLLADARGISGHLGVSMARVPRQPDLIPDPKEAIVGLARRSRNRNIRDSLVPASRSTAHVGREYNLVMCDFVETRWDLSVAALSSPSLEKALRRLKEYAPPSWC